MSSDSNGSYANKWSRRQFLQRTSVMGGAALSTTLSTSLGLALGAGLSMPALAFAAPEDDFLASSAFLTGHQLDKVLGARFLAALTKNDATFTTRMAALSAAIKQANVPDMDAFLALPNKDPALIATANEVVSAWYLGVVGKGADAVLISFEEALMFAPTKNYTYIPTYGGGPNSWVVTPPFKAA